MNPEEHREELERIIGASMSKLFECKCPVPQPGDYVVGYRKGLKWIDIQRCNDCNKYVYTIREPPQHPFTSRGEFDDESFRRPLNE